ncbi:MAG TPA: hypothetical protein VF339_00385 [Gammaproteobacteria bacterium]
MHVPMILRLTSMTGALVVATASAQGFDPEVTIRPIADATVELPAPVDRILALPDVASSIAVEASASGLARANEVRAEAGQDRASERAGERRGAGVGIAAEARVRGAEVAAEMAEAARAARESLVRGRGPVTIRVPAELPQLPEHVPDRAPLPGPPAAPQRVP